MATSGNHQKWLDFVARYYGDADYAKKVDADPTAELRKAGVSVPEDKQVHLVKNSDKTVHYVLPDMPATAVNVDELKEMYAGSCSSTYCEGGCSYTGNE